MDELQLELVILGAGGHAKVVVSAARAAGWMLVGAFDDAVALHGTQFRGVPVLGPLVDATALLAVSGIITIGHNAERKKASIRVGGLRWAQITHPTAWVDSTASIGHGTVVFAGAIVQADTRIGQHVIVNTGVSIDHDCVVGDFAHLAPGARLTGSVKVCEGAFVGVGASVVPGVTIGSWATVGAGAVVTEDVESGTTVVGVRAKPIKSTSSA